MRMLRHRQRNRVPFEPLMIAPDQVNAFFGIENEEPPKTSSTPDTPLETESQESTVWNMNVTDNSLWRTIAPKDDQTIVGSEGKRESTTYNMHVTDNSLWRTMVNKGDSQTTFASDDKRESTNYDLHVTDNPLWRTLPANQSDTQTLIEAQSKRESTNYNMHVTDNSLWRTMPAPNQGETQTYVEVESRRESTVYNMHVTDNPLWRTMPSNQISFASEDRRESTAYNFQVTDNSLWRTQPANQSSTQTSIEPESKRESTAYNMHVTDNQMWRTMPESTIDPDERRESTNLHVTDNTLWRTQAANQTQTLDETQNNRETVPENNQSSGENRQEPQDFLVPDKTLTTMAPGRQSQLPFALDNALMAEFQAVEQTRRQTLAPIQEESRTYVETQSQSQPESTHSKINFQFVTPPKASQETNNSPHKRISFHFATPTRSSLAKSNTPLPDCNRCEKSVEKTAPSPKRNPPRQSVEAFTQTSSFLANRDRRRTVLQQMHENSPGFPRRSIFVPPKNIENFQRRATTMAPFFNRLSSGSTSSASNRNSVGSTDTGTETDSPVRSKIPLRSPRSLPSAKSSSRRRSTTSSPRLADRVRVNEAIKVLSGTPVTSKLPVPNKPATPPTKPGDEPPQIVHLTNALQQIGIDYNTPGTAPRVANKNDDGAQKTRIDFNLTPSTPTRSNLFTSMFSTTVVKSGKIPHQTATMNASAKPRMLFDIGESMNDSAIQEDEGPCSQQIPSQLPPGRKPLSLLNDDDFTFGSPATPRVRQPKSIGAREAARCLPNIPNESQFVNETLAHFSLTNADESMAMSYVSGGSDRDTDFDSPAPKHIILRNKPATKKEPFLYVQPPKIVKGTDEFVDEHPNLRRSKRTRFARKLKMGEKPIYERDENGDLNLVGVQKGYTADPLCKKFGTFNKDEAMELQKRQTQQRKRVREMNRAQRAALNEKYGVDGDESF